jgi:environmental stress-induced protein Ves
MKLIRYSDLEVLPWKNGAGIRRDVMQGRYQAEGIDTTWLVSIADLNENAAFSIYPGISRWLTPISKGWMTLSFDDDGINMPVELTEDSPAHNFSGESSVHCILHDGPMKALNVMTSGDDAWVQMTKMRLLESSWITLPSSQDGDVSLLTVTRGVCRVQSDAWSGPVATLNSLVNDTGQDETFEIKPVDSAEVVIATIKLKSTERKLAQAA